MVQARVVRQPPPVYRPSHAPVQAKSSLAPPVFRPVAGAPHRRLAVQARPARGSAGVVQPFWPFDGWFGSTTQPVENKHGKAASQKLAEARQRLKEIPQGQLENRLTPKLLDDIHKLSYAPDSQYDSAISKLSPGYALKWVRGKHIVKPAEKRRNWAAAPESYTMRTYTYEEVQNVESYGAGFVGYQYENNLAAIAVENQVRELFGYERVNYPPYAHAFGKTVFRAAENIDRDLDALCREVCRMLSEARDPEDCYRIAAYFKQNFIAIHPYMDGNGRVSRLIADRILDEGNLGLPKWKDSEYDLNSSIPDIVNKIKKGL
jgi:fido (protein-threonine AMPylation protein)